MNLYFRILLLTLKNFFQRRTVHPLEEVVSSFTVLPNDIDINIHMNNGRYLTIMDLARFDFMGKVGLVKPLVKNRWFPIVGQSQLIYMRPLNPFQRYQVFTRIECWDRKWFVILHRFEVDGKTYAQGRIRGLFKGPKGIVQPKQLFEAVLDKAPKSPKASHTTQLWLDSIQSEVTKEKKRKAKQMGG